MGRPVGAVGGEGDQQSSEFSPNGRGELLVCDALEGEEKKRKKRD